MALSVISDQAQLRSYVDQAVVSCPVIDIHTHLFPPGFGELCLWGIDELLTYHYLVAELFRSSSATPAQFWTLSKPQQADLIWKTLFVDNTPLSEATRGVATVMSALGLDPAAPRLNDARKYFASQDLPSHIERVLTLSNVTDVVMTNDPFDPLENASFTPKAQHPRFHAALRLDSLLHCWSDSYRVLETQGYAVSATLSPRVIAECRRFLDIRGQPKSGRCGVHFRMQLDRRGNDHEIDFPVTAFKHRPVVLEYAHATRCKFP